MPSNFLQSYKRSVKEKAKHFRYLILTIFQKSEEGLGQEVMATVNDLSFLKKIEPMTFIRITCLPFAKCSYQISDHWYS